MRWWLAATVALLSVQAFPVQAELPGLGPELPEPLAAFASVWTPQGAYFFGGDTDLRQSDGIVHWVPGQDPVVLPEELPAPRWGGRAVWTGSEVLVFGGYDRAAGRSVAEVLRYAPGGSAPVQVAAMPGTRDWMAAFWDPRPAAECPAGCAYLVGGARAGIGALDTILRYEPQAKAFATMDARLPGGRWGLGAAWDGERAYLVGGYDGHRTHDAILAFDPVADTVAKVADLPWPAVDSAVTWHDGAVHIAGGHIADRPHAYATLVRWTPGDAAVGSCLPLPRPSQKGALVSTGDSLWLVGGYDDLPGRRFATAAMRELGWSPCLDTGELGLPEVPPQPVVAQPDDLAPEGVDVGGVVDIEWSADTGVQVTAMVQTGLALDVPGLPPADVALPFASIHSSIEGGNATVRLEFDVPGGLEGNASVYYHDGAAWVDLLADPDGVVPGAEGVEDLHVLDVGREPGKVWVDVSHTSVFAVAPASTAAQAPAPSSPSAPAAGSSAAGTGSTGPSSGTGTGDGAGEGSGPLGIPAPHAVAALALAALAARRRR